MPLPAPSSRTTAPAPASLRVFHIESSHLCFVSVDPCLAAFVFSQHRPRPGKFEGVAPEEAESLQRELAAVASPDWYGLLFAKDFKRHLDAAEQVGRGLREERLVLNGA